MMELSELKGLGKARLETLKAGCDRVNEMFGDKLEERLSVDWRYDPDEQKQEVTDDARNDEREGTV